ncbi:MAG TPA: ABC transporter ATP-binding protein [Dehalococcoidia bacterium]|nr:ABC transporter ATP-binding protein [Dehalococcoidia bacterium]
MDAETGESAATPEAVSLLETESLTKYYGPHRGVEELTLSAAPGEVLGFLGPNGSGKTTTIRVLLGFLRPTSGRASVLGRDVVAESVEVRRHVGYLPGDVALYGERTGEELLALASRARGKEPARARELASALEAPMDRPMKKCSRGMRQKVALVITLAHDPEVLILDEPTSGLDPLAQRTLLELLDQEGRCGKTVFFSSHVLSEAEHICDRVAILREGRLVVLDKVEKLRERKYKEVTLVHSGPPPNLEGLDDVQVVWRHDGRMSFRMRGDMRILMSRLAACAVEDLTIEEPSLEEVFLDYYREGAA